MSNRFDAFVAEVNMVKEYAMQLDPRLIYIAGLAKTDSSLTRMEILNFLREFQNELNSQFLDERIRNNILFKVSLGLLEEAKMILELRRDNRIHEYEYMLYGISSSEARLNVSHIHPSSFQYQSMPRPEIPSTTPIDLSFRPPHGNSQFPYQFHPQTNQPQTFKFPTPPVVPYIQNIQKAIVQNIPSQTPYQHTVFNLNPTTGGTHSKQSTSREKEYNYEQTQNITINPQPKQPFKSDVVNNHVCYICKSRFGELSWSVNSECGHKFHNDCLSKSLNSTSVSSFKCPVPGCISSISYSSIHIDSQKAQNAYPLISTCPNPSCDQQFYSVNLSKYSCSKCNQAWCLKCMQIFKPDCISHPNR